MQSVNIGETSVIRKAFFQDASSTTGAGLTGVTSASAGLVASYTYPGGTPIALTLETIATLGTYQAPTSNAHIRIKEEDAVKKPGWYELHFHNDWSSVANDRSGIELVFRGATNLVQFNGIARIRKTDVRQWLGSAPNALQAGRVDSYMGAIANGVIAAASFAAGAFDAVWSVTTRTLSGFGTLVADIWGHATRTLSAFGFNVTVGTNSDKTGYTLTAPYDPAKTAAQAGDAMTLTVGERTSVGTAVWATTTRTLSSFGSLVSDVATAVWGAVSRTLTAFSFTVNTNPNATETAIDAKTTNLPTDPADQSLIIAATDSILAAVNTRLAAAGYTAPDNAGISAIKAKTDNLPADPASNTQVNTRLSAAGYTAPDNAGVASVKSVTDKLGAMIEADGLDWRFDMNALEQAPAGGGGGGALTTEQANQLAAIAAKTALLGTQGVTVVGPVTVAGELDVIRGYEYTLASGFAPRWSSDDWPNLDGATVSLVEYQQPHTQIATGSVLAFGTGVQTVALSMPGTLTADLAKGSRKTLLQAILSGQTNPVPLAEVTLNVVA